MKSVCLGILLVFSISSAQYKTPNTSPSDLVITKSKLGTIVPVDVSPRDPPPKIDESPQFKGSPPSYEWRFKAELEVQNTGSRIINSIVWQFPLIVATNPEKIFQTYLVRSNKKIRPGETVKVASWIKGAYLKELRKPQRAGLLQGHGEIKFVNYADGRIWEASTVQH